MSQFVSLNRLQRVSQFVSLIVSPLRQWFVALVSLALFLSLCLLCVSATMHDALLVFAPRLGRCRNMRCVCMRACASAQDPQSAGERARDEEEDT